MIKNIWAAALAILVGATCTLAAERPTLNKHTRDPRPDILPTIATSHVEYRRQYNRPRYVTGLLAYMIEPSSQEAMVWQENVCRGSYTELHAPPVCKQFYFPKPWEVLQTGPRPDTHSTHTDMDESYTSTTVAIPKSRVAKTSTSKVTR